MSGVDGLKTPARRSEGVTGGRGHSPKRSPKGRSATAGGKLLRRK